MPRAISSTMGAWLTTSDTLTLAYCVLLTRLDGTQLAFTSCDVQLVINGITYDPSDSFSCSTLRQTINKGVDNLDVAGILRSDAITDADVQAGRYDGASLLFFACNYADLTMGTIILLSAQMGTVTTNDGQYTAELRGLSQQLRQQIGEVTSRTCRVLRLGDSRCQVPVTGIDPITGQPYQHPATVAAIASDQVTITITGTSQAAGYFRYGIAHFLTGLNANIEREVKDHQVASSTQIILGEPFPYAVAFGDTLWVEAGCDRLFGTCITKFNNAVRFRGEPMLPGIDQLLKVGRQ